MVVDAKRMERAQVCLDGISVSRKKECGIKLASLFIVSCVLRWETVEPQTELLIKHKSKRNKIEDAHLWLELLWEKLVRK